MTFSPASLRADIPILNSGIVYLDSAATTLKPRAVIDVMNQYYLDYPANVHRGVYRLSEQATEAFEHARESARQFFGARDTSEIIFTSGTTQSLNMAAQFCGQLLTPGDSVLLSPFEHHSNIVPWQLLAKERGITLLFLPVTPEGTLDIDACERIITPRTRVLSITHVSNASGAVTDLQRLIAMVKARHMIVVVDGAQSAPHMPINLTDLDVDFFACSAHKMLGPTGVGLLYIRKELHDQLEPVVGGGSMIREVTLEQSTWAEAPAKFEAGTPNIAGVIGFGAALNYLSHIDMRAAHAYIERLSTLLYSSLDALPFVQMHGPHHHQTQHSIASFSIDGVHPHDVASILDAHHIAVRAGHHCAQPLMALWNVPATTRASLYLYNTEEDIDRLVTGLHTVYSTFHR